MLSYCAKILNVELDVFFVYLQDYAITFSPFSTSIIIQLWLYVNVEFNNPAITHL